MNLHLHRVTLRDTEAGIKEALLIPDLPSSLLHGPIYEAVQLAALWRLRRGRPYAVVSADAQELQVRLSAEDYEYVRSLRRIDAASATSSRQLIDVADGDVSPLVPRSEEDFLLFLPAPPPSQLPRWPGLVTVLNAVFVSQVDEFVKLAFADSAIEELIRSLRQYSPG